MLKAVTIDLWGTLIKETPEGSSWTKAERIRRIGEVLQGERKAEGQETISRAYEIMGERLVAIWATSRDLGAQEQAALFLDILQEGKGTAPADSLINRLVDALTLPILSALPVPLDNASEVLAKLKSWDLRMALICNTGRTPGKTLRIILEQLNLAKYLSVQTFSDEVGLRKPRPEIFECTLRALGVEPSEALHVGDMLDSDIVGARDFGMRAVHVCRTQRDDARPDDGETIFSLPELLPIIERSRKLH